MSLLITMELIKHLSLVDRIVVLGILIVITGFLLLVLPRLLRKV